MTTSQSPTTPAKPELAGGVEVRSIDYIPVTERHGKPWHLGPVWFQGNAQLATLATGLFSISMGLNFLWSVIAIILGVLVGTLFMAFHSAQGPKLGLPQMIQSRAQFGYYGALLPVVVAVLLFIGFNVFNTILGAQAIESVAHTSNTTWPLIPPALLALALTVVGYRYIHIGLRWATWLFVIVYAVFTIGTIATIHLPHGALTLHHFMFGPFIIEFSAVVSYQLTWAPYVSEYSRYLPEDTKTSTVFWYTYGGSVLGAVMMLIGALVLAPNPTLQPIAAIDQTANHIFQGFGPIVLICSIPGIIAVVAMNMYSGGLSTLTAVDTVKKIRPTFTARWVSILFIAVAGTALAAALPENFLADFNNFLLIILYFMIPWTAINLIDFFFVRREHYAIRELFKPRGLYHAWGWRGLIAYAVSFGAMAPFFSNTIYTGPAATALSGGDISPFVGFPVAALVYFVLTRKLNVAAEWRIADEQRALLEREARELLAPGALEEDLLQDVGARIDAVGEGPLLEQPPTS